MSFNNVSPLILVEYLFCDRHAWLKEQETWFPILLISHFFCVCMCVCDVEMLFLELGSLCGTKMLLRTTARERPESLLKYWT